MSYKSLFLYQSEGRNPKREKKANSRVTGFLYPLRGGRKAGQGGP